MRLAYRFNIKENKLLKEMCLASNDLYNQAMYIVKKELKENKYFVGAYSLDKIMKTKPNLEGEINYYRLKSKTSQQILKLLESNWKSYFNTLKDWKRQPDKYKGMPNPPGYRPKGVENLLIFTNQDAKIKGGILKISKDIWIKIPNYRGKDFSKFNQIRVLPQYNGYKIEIVYTESIKNKILDYDKYVAIDLGLNNLATLISTETIPKIYNGKILKSYNQWYNKRKSKICSVKDKMKIKYYTKQLYKIEQDRENFITDYLHKVSKHIIQNCIKNRIGTLVVGHNKQWKDSIKLGNKTNQKFVQIPHFRLISYLKYKCELVGIKFIKEV